MHFDPKRWRIILALAFVELAIVGTMITAVTWRSHSASAATVAAGSEGRTKSVRHQVVTVGDHPHVVIDASDFAVEVVVGKDNEVVFDDLSEHSGVIIAGDRHVEVNQTDDGVRISAHESSSITIGVSDHHLRIVVPRSTKVEIADCASASIADLDGEIHAHSGNGRVSLDRITGDVVDIEAGNGRVEAKDVRTNSFTVHASNGRIIAQNIVLNGDEPTLEVVASNGKVEFGGTLPAGGTYSMESSNGSVNVALAEKSDTTVTATSSNGAVRAGSGVSLREDGDSRITTFGAGSGALSLSAPNGSITISRTNGV